MGRGAAPAQRSGEERGEGGEAGGGVGVEGEELGVNKR